jgi:hypothetical protein
MAVWVVSVGELENDPSHSYLAVRRIEPTVDPNSVTHEKSI